MDTGRKRGYRDAGLLPLSLGLTSVRFIVNKLEAEYSRAYDTDRQIVKYDSSIHEDDYHGPLDPSSGTVLNRFVHNLGTILSRCIPSVSFANFGALAVLAGFFAPKMISYLVLYPFCRLIFGTLYPAYASYKAVRTKNLKEYVKWMMYWIVFALFTCMETFTDVFLSWFPFYYEVKIVLVLWLLSPATKGSSILYRKFVHPALCRREQEIDEYIAKAKDQGYHTVLNLGTKGVNYATTVIMQTAIKGGGGLVQQIRKSYSLSDLTECDPRDERGSDEADDVMAEPQLIRRNVGRSGATTRRSASESNTRSAIYFSEVDVDVRSPRARADEPDFSHIKSTEDISSGYSSADNSGASLARTGSVGARVRPRAARTAVTAIKRPQAAEDSEVIIEELQDDDSFEYSNMPALMNVPSPLFLSHSEPPFIYQYVGDQIRIIQVLGEHPFNSNDIRNNDLKNNLNSTDSKSQQGCSAKADVKLEETVQLKNESQDVFEEAEFDNEVERNETVYKSLTEISVTDKVTDNIDPNNNQTKTENIKLEDKYDSNIAQLPVKEEENKIKNDVNTPVEVIPINTEENGTSGVEDTVRLSKEEAIRPDSLPNDNDTSDSDDEASFGTPEDSPKSKRKSPRGRYGKGKAPPPPPKVQSDNVNIELDKTSSLASLTTSQESLVDMLQTLPKSSFKETGGSNHLVVNPIAEKKRRHKSKSPSRIPKSSGTTIGKLLHIPSKLAFWQKDKNKGDNLSTSSGDHSRRSSTYERSEHFESCSELNKIIPLIANDDKSNEIEKAEDQISYKDASDIESEVISHDLMEKSDALQKLIDAKRQSHPEYKYTTVEDEIPTTSKSTDV